MRRNVISNSEVDRPGQIDPAEKIDRTLLEQIRDDRDPAAMEALYGRYYNKLLPFLRKISSDAGVIEEAYNDTMLAVWRKADQFEGKSKVATWIYSIGYRNCLKVIDKESRKSNLLQKILSFQTDDDPGETEADFEFEGANQALHIAIKSLNAKQQMVVALFYFQEHTIEEISEIIGSPINTVKTRLHHARSKIREQLTEEDFGSTVV